MFRERPIASGDHRIARQTPTEAAPATMRSFCAQHSSPEQPLGAFAFETQGAGKGSFRWLPRQIGKHSWRA
jgi:hypothetical protein